MQKILKTLPDNNASSTASENWADELECFWLETLELNKAALTFTKEEAEALENYLYATELLIRCKNAAIRIPKQAWAELEAQLLTV